MGEANTLTNPGGVASTSTFITLVGLSTCPLGSRASDTTRVLAPSMPGRKVMAGTVKVSFASTVWLHKPPTGTTGCSVATGLVNTTNGVTVASMLRSNWSCNTKLVVAGTGSG